MSSLIDLTGDRYGRLTVLRRGEDYVSPKGTHVSLWLCRCDCGADTEVRSLSLRNGRTQSCGCLKSDTGRDMGKRNIKESVSYYGAHDRVKRERGSSSYHACTDCGGVAQEWSYDNTDPDELFESGCGAYSTKPEHYSPRCVPCHRAFDKETINVR